MTNRETKSNVKLIASFVTNGSISINAINSKKA